MPRHTLGKLPGSLRQFAGTCGGAAPRSGERGERQHQPHQVHLPGEAVLAVHLPQVPVDLELMAQKACGSGAHLPPRAGGCRP